MVVSPSKPNFDLLKATANFQSNYHFIVKSRSSFGWPFSVVKNLGIVDVLLIRFNRYHCWVIIEV